MAKTLKRNKEKYTKKMRKIGTKRKKHKKKNTKRKYNKVKNTKRKYNKANKNILNLNNGLIRIKKQRGGDPPEQRVIGSDINGYEIVEELGAGSFGRVYKVSKGGKFYALKEIKLRTLALGIAGEWNVIEIEEEGTTYNFRETIGQPDINREIKYLKILKNNPGVSQIEETFEADGSQFICLDFYLGGELYTYNFPTSDVEATSLVFNISRQLLVALQGIHNQDIVHLDLKPENIMVDENKKVFISDFGLSMHRDDISEVSSEGGGVIYKGTMLYMDPLMYSWMRGSELRDFNDYKLNDIFSLGSILYELYDKILNKKMQRLKGEPTDPQTYWREFSQGNFNQFRNWLERVAHDWDHVGTLTPIDKFLKICHGLMNIDIEGVNRPEPVNRYTIQRALEELDELIIEHNAAVTHSFERVPVYVSEPEPQPAEPDPEPEPQPAEPDPGPKELPEITFLLEGYCYKQKPTLTSRWPKRYMVLFQKGTKYFIYFYNNNEEADRDLYRLSQGVDTVQRGSSITDLTLYTYRQGKENFPTIDMFSGGKDLDTIILEKEEGKEEAGAFNNTVSLAFRTDMGDAWVKKDELLTKLTELGLTERDD